MKLLAFGRGPFALALALAVAGCGDRATPPSMATPSAVQNEEARVHVNELELRLDLVRRLREAYSAMRKDAPGRFDVGGKLADALAALAAFHRAAAIEADPKAASLPPPPDRRERKADGTGEEESDAPPPPEPPDLPRDAATLAALAPAARAHVYAADRCAREAVDVLYQIEGMSDATRDARRKLAARRAQLLMDLGQATEARFAYASVVRADRADALSAMAWLAFAEWFSSQKKTEETSKSLAKAADAAATVKEATLLRRICDRARAMGADVPAPCTR